MKMRFQLSVGMFQKIGVLKESYSGNPCFCQNMLFQRHLTLKSRTPALVSWVSRFLSRSANPGDADRHVRDKTTSPTRSYEAKSTGSRNPTVFYDSMRIFVKGGAGGQGLPRKGGIGGKGGDVIVVGNKKTTLRKIYDQFPIRRFVAGTGQDSKLFCLYGEPAKPVLIQVPIGVSIITELGHKLGEINTHGQQLTVASGGVGASPSNGFSHELGQSHNITLDLKLIADVGFVGFPNAGKSTLLKAISRASPKIASYPFTTIRPNVGVVDFSDFRRITLADLPGLIEGAHANIGMGHKFLKHVVRTKVLLFVVDIHGFQLGPKYPQRSALETIVLLNKELELYNEELTEKPAVLALNKFDLPGSYEIISQIKETIKDRAKYETFLKTMPREFLPKNVIQFDEIIPISAAKDTISVDQLKNRLRSVIDANEELGLSHDELN